MDLDAAGLQVQEAESLLLQAGLTYRAIDINCTLCRWDRYATLAHLDPHCLQSQSQTCLSALALAIKHKTHVDTVLGLRQRYLTALNQPETKVQFLEYASTVEVDWEAIQSKIEAEWEAERTRPGAKPYA